LGLVFVPAEQVESASCDFTVLPLADALARQVLPLVVDGRLQPVLGEPLALGTRSWAQRRWPAQAAILGVSAAGAVRRRLAQLQARERAMDRFVGDAPHAAVRLDATPEISLTSIARDESTVVRLLNSTLFDALQSRASDIHLESTAAGLAVKYRIDGVLHLITEAGGVELAEQTVSRLKVLAGLDIGERRVPQDGRFKAIIQERSVDFRVSIMPSVHGEDGVLRVLDKSHDGAQAGFNALRLETLGFDAATLERIRVLAHAPHGMMLVTGPTGSGKSTTLYASLVEINSGQSKIITIEDPVEYQLDGVLQIPVNDKKGLSFARGLRSILRHDPDIILVGEIRDGETAGIAVQAALTGHLVLSSVHANGVFSVLERFVYMQIEPASLLEALNGIVAQRLVRRVCETCAVPAAPSPAALAARGLSAARLGAGDFKSGRGCDACRHSGYRGRLALAEVLKCTDSFKEAMLARTSPARLRAIAEEAGFISLERIALDAVRAGATTLEEIGRVVAMH
jgi:general secretion pathway protein E